MDEIILNQVAEIEIHYKKRRKGTVKVNSSSVMAQEFRKVWTPDLEVSESVYVMYLNRAMNILAITLHSKGGISGSSIDSRLILAPALKMLASGIAICHNHPSDNLTPSESDKLFTQRLKKAAEIFDIKLLDSVILDSNSNHYSFSDQGLL